MKIQSLSFIFFLAIALVACRSIETDMDMKPISRNDDQQTRARDMEAVVHNSRGANGGSDLTTKPSRTKNGAADLPLVISFWVSMLVIVSGFFLLQV